jgi:type I toxin-antitoxin system toxin SymE
MKRDGHIRNKTARRIATAELDQITYVGSAIATRDGEVREIPAIVLRGEWLKALGFPIGAPIYLFAEAHGRMAIYRPGLHKPRWLRIVAPGGDPSTR